MWHALAAPLTRSFHCFVLIAAAMHYVAVCRGYLFWHSIEELGGSAGTGAVCAALDTLI